MGESLDRKIDKIGSLVKSRVSQEAEVKAEEKAKDAGAKEVKVLLDATDVVKVLQDLSQGITDKAFDLPETLVQKIADIIIDVNSKQTDNVTDLVAGLVKELAELQGKIDGINFSHIKELPPVSGIVEISNIGELEKFFREPKSFPDRIKAEIVKVVETREIEPDDEYFQRDKNDRIVKITEVYGSISIAYNIDRDRNGKINHVSRRKVV